MKRLYMLLVESDVENTTVSVLNGATMMGVVQETTSGGPNGIEYAMSHLGQILDRERDAQ